MASKSADANRKSLVIVESPAKARTISKFLGKNYTVEASIGHVRNLPQGTKEVPEEFKREEWAYLGVNVKDKFQPIYIVPPSKRQQVSKLRKALKESKDLYLATDEDREGEAISWHLCELLKPRVPVHRLVFHEITQEAIQESLDNPRQIDEGLVRQETRRILDRLYGYDVSQLLWRKVGPGLSAGRVQSVAVRLIVDRERERMAHVAATYWDLVATLLRQDGTQFEATLMTVGGRRIPRAKDFEATTGKLKDESLIVLDEPAAHELARRVESADFQVASLDVKPFIEKPKPPFTTSTLQQEANRKLGFTARRTMNAAQSLYDNGYITYMRTDSTTLADVAIQTARQLVRSEYGEAYLDRAPRVYASTVKNAQEAHEAIRPAGHDFPTAQRCAKLRDDEFRLYDMIWKRTVASQMADARKRRITITVAGADTTFQVSGTTIDFEGFLRAYVEGSDDPEGELANRETLLPPVDERESLGCRKAEPKQHTTQPPARYTEATLTRTLEEKGIGRPSTYAAIIETIQARDYVFKKGNALVPSWTAFSVVRLLEDHLPSLVDYEFTAQMEDYLDAISRREAGHVQYLDDFYFGDGRPGLKRRLESKEKEIDPRMASRFEIGRLPGNDQPIVLRVGKYGPFLEHGERKASLPEGLAPDELTLERAEQLLEQASRDEEPLGHCPETQKPVYVKQGRFGPYVQLGSPDDADKPRNASLLKGMTPADVTLEVALKLLTLPRELGQDPQAQQPVIVSNGRYGPYVKCGDETRSLPADISPLDVTLDQAIDLLRQPKTRGRGRATPREPLKVFANSPVTDQPVRFLEGRYGPYVTDGVTNASVPKGTDTAQVSFELALQLLADRAAKAPARRTSARRSAPSTKSTVAKSSGGRSAAARKPAVRKKASTKKAAPKRHVSNEPS